MTCSGDVVSTRCRVYGRKPKKQIEKTRTGEVAHGVVLLIARYGHAFGRHDVVRTGGNKSKRIDRDTCRTCYRYELFDIGTRCDVIMLIYPEKIKGRNGGGRLNSCVLRGAGDETNRSIQLREMTSSHTMHREK